MPLGVTGNTSASGAEESWFDPRRGNSLARLGLGSGARGASSISRHQGLAVPELPPTVTSPCSGREWSRDELSALSEHVICGVVVGQRSPRA